MHQKGNGEGVGGTICWDPDKCSVNCIANPQTTNHKFPHNPSFYLSKSIRSNSGNPTRCSFSTSPPAPDPSSSPLPSWSPAASLHCFTHPDHSSTGPSTHPALSSPASLISQEQKKIAVRAEPACGTLTAPVPTRVAWSGAKRKLREAMLPAGRKGTCNEQNFAQQEKNRMRGPPRGIALPFTRAAQNTSLSCHLAQCHRKKQLEQWWLGSDLCTKHVLGCSPAVNRAAHRHIGPLDTSTSSAIPILTNNPLNVSKTKKKRLSACFTRFLWTGTANGESNTSALSSGAVIHRDSLHKCTSRKADMHRDCLREPG